MDIPSPISGKVKEVKISEGDTVNTGDLIAMAEVDEAQASPEKSESAAEKKQSPVEKGEEVETNPGNRQRKRESLLQAQQKQSICPSMLKPWAPRLMQAHLYEAWHGNLA